jgi:hypothetical protein
MGVMCAHSKKDRCGRAWSGYQTAWGWGRAVISELRLGYLQELTWCSRRIRSLGNRNCTKI